MELPPCVYDWLVRPSWWTELYIHNKINHHFQLRTKAVLDFGCGVGSHCRLTGADSYIGLDPCPRRVRFASRKYPDYRFFRLEGKELPTPNRHFDYILIVAVLHHVSSPQLCQYIQEFRRVLKEDGTVIVMEPCLSNKCHVQNWFMKNFDKGRYLRCEREYLEMFHNHKFKTQVLSRFRKLLLYNELFFVAQPIY